VINGSWINTGFKEGEVVLYYEGLETDEDGLPMMPDNVSYLEACFWYCVMKLMLGGSYESKVIKYESAEQKWHHYVAQSRGKFYMPDNDKMESIKRQWVRLIPVINAHSSEFSVLNRYEQSKV
jgi:hypothetical protein